MTDPSAKGTYALVSLGCPKNLVDSERMAGLLLRDGYRLVERPEDADFVLINTCGFIADAREESLGVIREMLDLRRRGRLRRVIVAGCLAERDREALLQECPEIDQLLGVFARDEIATAVGRLFADEENDGSCQRGMFRPAVRPPLDDRDRLRLTPRHVAFLRIAEGCDRACSFCAIPQIRGPYASKPIEQIVAEAEQLAADGVRELVVIAQDTSYYGRDLYGEPRLAELLGRLEVVDGLAWIRLMYLYPMYITDDLIGLMADCEKVLPYFDLPLQHINDEILRRMRRAVGRQETQRLLERLRGRIGSAVLRTTLIVGFPGETEAEFEELLDFVGRQRFERLGVFAYRGERGTHAAGLPGQVPKQVRQERRERLMAAQQAISFAWGTEQVGRRLDVIVDRDIPGQKNAYVGRSYADAPEVDCVVYVTGEGLSPGQIVACEIVASHDYDLIGVADE